MSNVLENIAQVVSRELTVLFTAILPGIELRGAIPVGLSLGMVPLEAFVVSYIGSLLPAIPIILFLAQFLVFCSRIRLTRPLAQWLTTRTHKKGRQVERYSLWGLFLLVAVPLPLTGVWTGSMVASLASRATFTPMAMSGDCSSMDVRTAQVSLSKPYLARVYPMSLTVCRTILGMST